MGGAALLATKAALATGAGMVKVYTAKENRNLLLREVPEALVSSYDQDQWKEEELLEALEWASVIGIGPGLSTSFRARSIWKTVKDYCKKKEGREKPLLIDGDGLNLGAEEKDLWEGLGDKCIITPHVKEMARKYSFHRSGIWKGKESLLCFKGCQDSSDRWKRKYVYQPVWKSWNGNSGKRRCAFRNDSRVISPRRASV